MAKALSSSDATIAVGTSRCSPNKKSGAERTDEELHRALVHRRHLRRKRNITRVLRYVVIVGVCVVALFPVYWMLLSAIQPSRYVLTYPPALFPAGFDLHPLLSLFDQNPIALWLENSLEVSAVTVGVTIVLSVPGAYLLSRLRWRGVGVFAFLLLFTQLMPGAMLVVPELQLYRVLGWTNNLYALALLYAAFNVPLGCWILKSSFDAVPGEVIDASLVDGCGRLRVLRYLLLPLSRAGTVAVAVVAFFGSWNDYIFASVMISTGNHYTAGLGIATLTTAQTVHLDQLEAAGVVFSVLPVLLYLVFQRHIVRGFTAGALK